MKFIDILSYLDFKHVLVKFGIFVHLFTLLIRHIIVLFLHVLSFENSHFLDFVKGYLKNRLFIKVTQLVFVEDEEICCHESISQHKVR